MNSAVRIRGYEAWVLFPLEVTLVTGIFLYSHSKDENVNIGISVRLFIGAGH